MDHRLGSRASRNYLVELLCHGAQLGQYLSRDISLGGIFVHGCAKQLAAGDFLKVRITIDDNFAGDRYELKAIVVHCSGGGAGLMWAEYEPAFLENVSTQLRATQRAFPASRATI